MPKLYTTAEWNRIQMRYPEDDRIPYADSPEAVESAPAETEKTSAEKAAEKKTAREKAAAEAAAARAASDPMFDPTNRPEAPPADDEYIYYYGWIGGAGSGEWKLYKTSVDSYTAESALARSTGGKTQATSGSAVGANVLAGASATGPTGTLQTGPTGPTGTGQTGPTGITSITSGTGSKGGSGTSGGSSGGGKTVVSTYTDPVTGNVYIIYSDGSRELAFTGNTQATAAAKAAADAKATAEAKKAAGQSAYSLLFEEFSRYGLGALVEPLKEFIVEGLSPAEFTLRLRQTDAYKRRFAANAQRVNKGLRALSEAEYIGLEDQYQDIMRRYGLPASYYARGEMGRQEGFEKFIGLDVSPVELEDRVQTAYNRVFMANAEVNTALRSFYPEITNGDILAYVLDPEKALGEIKRKITAAEIGGAAVSAGLTTNESDASYLARYGVTKEQAQAGYRTISGYLPRAQQLSSIYQKQGEGPYTQATAEQEIFNVPGAAEAERKRLKLAALETSAFSGQAGISGGALGRERAGQF